MNVPSEWSIVYPPRDCRVVFGSARGIPSPSVRFPRHYRVAPETAGRTPDIFRKQFGRVALGVDGDKQNLNTIGVRAELFHRLGKRRERRRTDVWTFRVAEKHDDRLAAEIRERPVVAVVIVQREVAAE